MDPVSQPENSNCPVMLVSDSALILFTARSGCAVAAVNPESQKLLGSIHGISPPTVSCVTVVGDRKAVVIICVYLTVGTKRKSVAASQKNGAKKEKRRWLRQITKALNSLNFID